MQAKAPQNAGLAPPVQRRYLVLIADDDESVRAVIRDGLSVDGFDVAEAIDGIECVDKAKKLRPAVVLIDIDMPKKDGWTACKEIRSAAETKQIPVLMLSAHTERQNREKAVACGASHFLPKPIAIEQLLTILKSLTRGAHVRPGPGRGKISWVSQEQGYGFVVPDDGSNKIFFVSASCTADAFKSLTAGLPVAYDVELSQGTARAVRVRPLN